MTDFEARKHSVDSTECATNLYLFLGETNHFENTNLSPSSMTIFEVGYWHMSCHRAENETQHIDVSPGLAIGQVVWDQMAHMRRGT